MATLYQDKSVTIDEDGLIIPNYYFPRLSPRRILWSELRSARLRPLSLWDGKLRLWGMALRPFWFNLDMRRFLKSQFIALDVGQMVNPAITPDDPEIAYSVIDQRLQAAASKAPPHF